MNRPPPLPRTPQVFVAPQFRWMVVAVGACLVLATVSIIDFRPGGASKKAPEPPQIIGTRPITLTPDGRTALISVLQACITDFRAETTLNTLDLRIDHVDKLRRQYICDSKDRTEALLICNTDPIHEKVFRWEEAAEDVGNLTRLSQIRGEGDKVKQSHRDALILGAESLIKELSE